MNAFWPSPRLSQDTGGVNHKRFSLFFWKENISCSIQKDRVSPFWNSGNIICIKIQYKLLKVKPLRSQRARQKIALIVLYYLTGTDFFTAFASPVCGWVDETLVHGASSNWTQALMDDDRPWLPSTAESTLGCSAASSSSVQKGSWNPPFALWFSSEDVSEEFKHFTRGASVPPKIETTEIYRIDHYFIGFYWNIYNLPLNVGNFPSPNAVFGLTLGSLALDYNRWDFLHGWLDTVLNFEGQIQNL